jgi:hypothetical protein
MNTRTQNIINLSVNLSVITGSLVISSYAYSIAPQLAPFNPIPRIAIAVSLAGAVKIFRAYPYYLSTITIPAPGAWRWLILGLALEGFDGAVLVHTFKLRLSIDSALGAIAAVAAYSGSWAIVSLLADLGLRPVKRRRFYSGWFVKSKPVTETVTPSYYLPADELLTRSPQSNNSDSEFISQLIPKIASLFVVGLSGSGKDFTTSVLAGFMRSRFGAKIFYIDPKHSDNEADLWAAVADYRYQFKGTLMNPDEFLQHLRTAFGQYQTQLAANGSGYYTILVLNELATCATKIDSSSDKKYLAATLQPMISGLDSEGGAVWVLTQTTSMPSGFNNGIVSQFQKLIICRQEQIENLKTQAQNTLMKGVDLSAALVCCQQSEIDRAIYSSASMKWRSLPALRKGESYYDRDSRAWVGAKTPPIHPNSDGNTRTHQALSDPVSTLDAGVLGYFEAVLDTNPKTIRDIRMATRVRRLGATAKEIQETIDRLTRQGLLDRSGDGYRLTCWDGSDLN